MNPWCSSIASLIPCCWSSIWKLWSSPKTKDVNIIPQAKRYTEHWFFDVEQLDEKLKKLGATIESLFEEILGRLESEFGKELVSKVMGLLLVSKDGEFKQSKLKDRWPMSNIVNCLNPRITFIEVHFRLCTRDQATVNLCEDPLLEWGRILARILVWNEGRSLRGSSSRMTEKPCEDPRLEWVRILARILAGITSAKILAKILFYNDRGSLQGSELRFMRSTYD
jgi:hypothetical protein